MLKTIFDAPESSYWSLENLVLFYFLIDMAQ